jgi:hypothetical protein
LKDLKNLLKKEEETHNMVMEKHTHTHPKSETWQFWRTSTGFHKMFSY